MHIQINKMGKRDNRKLYKVYGIETGHVIHSGGGATACHYALNSNDIVPARVGKYVGMRWTNGNYLFEDLSTTRMSGFCKCGVQLYDHPEYGQVYLVYNPNHQKPLPVPLSTTTNERLPHPFQ